LAKGKTNPEIALDALAPPAVSGTTNRELIAALDVETQTRVDLGLLISSEI
jgi:hypothetical protein